MKLRHPNHYAIAKTIASAMLMAAAGCATPDTEGPQAWRIEAVFNVKHAIQSSQGYYTLGRYHDGSKAWEQAIDAYRKAIAIDAHNVEAYNALGVALAQSGRHADAETVLRQAVALAPELTHVRSNLGYVLMLAGKPDEAVLELKAAVLQDRGNSTAMTNLRDALAQRDAARNGSETAGAATVTKPEAIASTVTKSVAIASAVTKPVAIAFSNSAETVMVTRTASVEPAAAMIKVEVPTAAGVTKPVAAGEVPALSTLAALRVIDQPTIAWGQQPAVVAVAEAVFNPVSVFPLLPVPLTFAAMGRVGTGQQVSKLEVSNGNGTAGMAASVGRWLAALGLPASRLTDQRPYTQVQTLVQFRNGHEEAAMRVARSLPGGGKALLVPTQGLRADVRVVLGRDSVPTNACLKRDACQPVFASVMPITLAARDP